MEKDEENYDLQPLCILIPDQSNFDPFYQLPHVIDFASSSNDTESRCEGPISPQLITLLELAPIDDVLTLENTEAAGIELNYGVRITSSMPSKQVCLQPNTQAIGVELEYGVGITSLMNEGVLTLENRESSGVELGYEVGITPSEQICSQPQTQAVDVELDYGDRITSLMNEGVVTLENTEVDGVESGHVVGITSSMPSKQVYLQPNTQAIAVELKYGVGITSLINEEVLTLENRESSGAELGYEVGITPSEQTCSQLQTQSVHVELDYGAIITSLMNEGVVTLENTEVDGVESGHGVGITSSMPSEEVCLQPNTQAVDFELEYGAGITSLMNEGVLTLENREAIGAESDCGFNELLNLNEPSEQIFCQPRMIEEEGLPAQTLYAEFDYGFGATSLIPNEFCDNLNEQEGLSSHLENINRTGIETVVNENKKRKPKQDHSEKIRIALERKSEKYKVKGDCSCKRGCPLKISLDRRVEINKKFWDFDYIAQKLYVQCQTSVATPSRTKHPTAARLIVNYFFKTKSGETHQVCQQFFLTTLGFKVNNNTFVRNALDKEFPEPDGRGRHLNKAKFDETIVIDHIMSFHPETSHYRREHTPHRIYLPSDVTITKMHKLYIEQHQNKACSYDYYRKVVDKMNISFTKLGHEKCEKCEEFYRHMEITHNQNENCETCIAHKIHKRFYDQARIYYQADKLLVCSRKHVIVSGDLEKVVMLPRMEQFKDVLFTKRICAFNETFAPLGGSTNIPVFAAIWHEGIAGRKKKDIISSYHSFLLHHRDGETITIWCDNCTSQNKCWALFSFLVYIVNSTEIAAEIITMKFLEKGHTFMSADSFHHQVELSMKNHEKSNVCDFEDFTSCVQFANSGRVACKQMTVTDFADWEDWSSLAKLNNAKPRPYIAAMSRVKFVRGKMSMFYANDFDGEWSEIDFIMGKHQHLVRPEPRSIERGISQEVKNGIITKLTRLMPVNRRNFWYDIYTN